MTWKRRCQPAPSHRGYGSFSARFFLKGSRESGRAAAATGGRQRCSCRHGELAIQLRRPDYATRSIGDADCIFSITILKRTPKSVWIVGHNDKTVTRRIAVRDGVETFKPYGSYSMAPTIRADKKSV